MEVRKEITKKRIEVMQAYVDGCAIEILERGGGKGWHTVYDPGWDWNKYDYRVRGNDPKGRPYQDCEECWEDMKKHEPFGWLKHRKHGGFMPVPSVYNSLDFQQFHDAFTYVDGAPFGIVEEE